MAHATFNSSGVPRGRTFRAQMALDAIFEKNQKKYRAYLKEKNRLEAKGQSNEQYQKQSAKSRRL